MSEPKHIDHPFLEGFAMGLLAVLALMAALAHPGPAHDPSSPDFHPAEASR